MTGPYDADDYEQTRRHDADAAGYESSSVRDDADEALDHALRERPADGEEYDDQPTDADGEEGDYVLYSEVRPHLEALVQLQNERAKMVELLLYARDRVSSPAVASRMDDHLAQLGIGVLTPAVGDLFDAQQHEASATVPTEDARLHGTIAEVEMAGYSDGDHVVRHPIVTVYSAQRGPA